MRQNITPQHIQQLSESSQRWLMVWFLMQLRYDDDNVHVYIPQEKDGQYAGVFEGAWGGEYEFDYPEEYVGKLKNHKGTVIPLLTIGEMIAFLDQYDNNSLASCLHLLTHSEEAMVPWSFDTSMLLDALWERAQAVIRYKAGR